MEHFLLDSMTECSGLIYGVGCLISCFTELVSENLLVPIGLLVTHATRSLYGIQQPCVRRESLVRRNQRICHEAPGYERYCNLDSGCSQLKKDDLSTHFWWCLSIGFENWPTIGVQNWPTPGSVFLVINPRFDSPAFIPGFDYFAVMRNPV